jgi:hypothetical protein
LAGLADEYAYGGYFAPSIEPKNVNVTINNDLETVKWKHWVGEPTIDDNKPVGLYEGGKYVKTGVWRPTHYSIMRINGKPFYYVNAEQWALSVYKIAGVIYSKTPKNNQITQAIGSDSIFTVEPSMGASAQQIVWQVDDVNQSIANSGDLQLKVTNKKHIRSFDQQNGQDQYKMYEVEGLQEQNDGNNVNLDQQMSMMAKNNVMFSAIQSSIKKDMNWMSQVIAESGKN